MKFGMAINFILLASLLFIRTSLARIHKYDVKGDVRRYISLSTFGFYKGGILDVKLINFKPNPFRENDMFGFSIDRTSSDAMNPYLDSHGKCLLQGLSNSKYDLEQRDDTAIIYLTFNLKTLQVNVNCTPNIESIHIYKDSMSIPVVRDKRNSLSSKLSDAGLFPKRKKDISEDEFNNFDNLSESEQRDNKLCSSIKLVLTKNIIHEEAFFSTSFAMHIATESEKGQYNLYFHNCPNYKDSPVAVDFSMEIKEINNESYLSAGEMPLPALYFMMSMLFFFSGCFWAFILQSSRHPVFKIHYLMGILVFLKSFSLLFHGINYHFIEIKGEHVAAWAILYYVTYLLKGAVLFITIVLVGTGWTFIKHILSDRDKKLFMIVIPLQVLANVAKIIIEESEEGDIEHKRWQEVFLLVDLICCGVIMFPVVWSIRHLELAAHMDGKAASNLRKLKLFRHFYIMIVCYIYFTRVIVYLLKITVAFQYKWLDEMFKEMATFIFFVLTGYKFRPASENPYFSLTTEDLSQEEDEENDVVLFSSISGKSSVSDGLSKIHKMTKVNRTIITEIPANEEEKDNLISKREASHEYD